MAEDPTLVAYAVAGSTKKPQGAQQHYAPFGLTKEDLSRAGLKDLAQAVENGAELTVHYVPEELQESPEAPQAACVCGQPTCFRCFPLLATE